MTKSVIVAGLKGGTGKSMISAMLSSYLAQKKGNVLLIDADVDSPNLAEILKVDPKDVRITPDFVEIAHLDGMDFFSMGLFAKDKAISMSSESYVQMLLDLTSMSRLNIDHKKATVVIDLPAGASSIFKATIRAFADSLVGVVVVITPQAVHDLKRLVRILKHHGLPILGVVENMSRFECECGKSYSFSSGEVAKVCDELGIEYLGDIPFSPEIHEVISAGIPYIPEQLEPVLELIEDKIEKSKPVGRGILERIVRKVSEKVKRNIKKIVAKTIIRVNKELDLRKLTSKGFGGNIVELIITDKGEELAKAYMKLTDNKVIAMRETDKSDLTITAEIDALLSVARGETDLEDAFFLGDIEVYGKGGTVRALSFFEQVWRVMRDEITSTVEVE